MNPVSLVNYHLNNSPFAIIEWDNQFRVRSWSDMAEVIFGWKESEVLNLDPFEWQFVYIDDQESVSLVMKDLLTKKVTRNISANRNYTKDGRVVYCEWYNSLLFTKNGNLLSVLSIALEVTKTVNLEQEVIKKRELAETTLQLFGDGLIITDSNYRVSYINSLGSDFIGLNYQQAVGFHLDEVFTLRNQSITLMINDYIHRGFGLNSLMSFNDDYYLVSAQGKEINIEFTAISTGNNCVLLFSDGKDYNSLVGKLKHQAEKDSLTGLLNRYCFEKKLAKAIATVTNSENSHTLCYLDLDRFQIINDTCGHCGGDQLLKQLALFLEQELGHLGSIAGLGGDEFAILLLDHDLKTAAVSIHQIRDKINNLSFVYENATFKINASFGLVEINRDSPNYSLVLSAADAACFAAKEAGRNKIRAYHKSDEILKKMQSDRQWTIKINEAIKYKKFCLYQQKIEPTIKIAQPKAMYEVLLRMVGDEGNLITPLNFIPAAERYGLMCDIDMLVVEMLVTYLQNSELLNNQYLVNLSGTTIDNSYFLKYIQELCVSKIIVPEMVCFEITETATISNLKQAVKFIEKLKEIGFKFALDDFGSGMCSFTYLQTLPVDYIKIDGSFVKNMFREELSYVIVESIQKIAKTVNIKTIAEFVENEEIRHQLVIMGVDYVQGYGIGRVYPMTE